MPAVYITQLIYIHEGKEHLLNEFEERAAGIISKYNGQFLLRIRPPVESFLHHHIEPPFEIHLVRFETDKDLEAYQQDEERKKHIHLKEQAVKSVVLIRGALI